MGAGVEGKGHRGSRSWQRMGGGMAVRGQEPWLPVPPQNLAMMMYQLIFVGFFWGGGGCR